jgi:hypothetical protein
LSPEEFSGFCAEPVADPEGVESNDAPDDVDSGITALITEPLWVKAIEDVIPSALTTPAYSQTPVPSLFLWQSMPYDPSSAESL